MCNAEITLGVGREQQRMQSSSSKARHPHDSTANDWGGCVRVFFATITPPTVCTPSTRLNIQIGHMQTVLVSLCSEAATVPLSGKRQ